MRELLSVVFNMSMSLNHDATLRKAFLILVSVLTVNTYIHTSAQDSTAIKILIISDFSSDHNSSELFTQNSSELFTQNSSELFRKNSSELIGAQPYFGGGGSSQRHTKLGTALFAGIISSLD